VALLLGCLGAPGPAGAAEVTGSLVPQGGVVPAGAQVAITLRVTESASRLGHAVAETRFRAPGQAGPIAFALPFEPSALAPGRAYAVAVRVTEGGQLLWHNVDRVAVPQGAGRVAVQVPLVRAGTPAAPVPPAAASASPPARSAAAPVAPPPPQPTRLAVARGVTSAPLPPEPAPPPAAPPPAVAAPAAAPAPAAPEMPGPAVALRCTGNEPGWSLLVQGGLARLRTQADQGREVNTVARYTAAPWAEPPFAMLRVDVPGAGTAVALLVAEACTDSLSGDGQPIRARVSMPDGTLRMGCCRSLASVAPGAGGVDAAAPWAAARVQPASQFTPAGATDEAVPAAVRETDARETEARETAARETGARETDARETDWAHLLPGLLPAVQACAVARPGQVVRAWSMPLGKAGVRIMVPGGARYDCLADIAAARVERVGIVVPVEPMPGEGRPVFRPGVPASAEACRAIETVRAPDGTPVGSLAWETCR
jgi:uncharacterized lipoprotein YbaY/uncharacterized membrane protein